VKVRAGFDEVPLVELLQRAKDERAAALGRT
jgi:hypothetical protein